MKTRHSAINKYHRLIFLLIFLQKSLGQALGRYWNWVGLLPITELSAFPLDSKLLQGRADLAQHFIPRTRHSAQHLKGTRGVACTWAQAPLCAVLRTQVCLPSSGEMGLKRTASASLGSCRTEQVHVGEASRKTPWEARDGVFATHKSRLDCK